MVKKFSIDNSKERIFLFFYLGDSSFKFSKDTWNKLFEFSTNFSSEDRTLRLFGQFTQAGIEELSNQAHTLEVFCQIPPHYGRNFLMQKTKNSCFLQKSISIVRITIMSILNIFKVLVFTYKNHL
mgnify:CR=1 FL=1